MVAVSPDRDDAPGPYARDALAWFDAGWEPLPLPAGAKWPPPKGFTGYDEPKLTRAQIKKWIKEFPDGNICLRLPKNVLGVDVDAYGDKHGDLTLAQLEEIHGSLPPGIRFTARGFDQPAGIKLYRIREGAQFPGVLGPGIEAIQWFHRYAVAPGSINPETGTEYVAWDDATGESVGVFTPADLDPVPEDWYAVEAIRGKGLDKHNDLELAEVRQWFDLEQNAASYCRAMRNVYTTEVAKLEAAAESGESRYDTARDGVMALVRLAQEGHRGCKRALAGLKRTYAEVLEGEKDRDPYEWQRMVAGAVSAVSEDMAEPHAAGKCPDRAPSGGDVDPSLWPSPNDPFDVAERFVAERYTYGADSDAPSSTLAYWHGEFYRWTGPHWEEMPLDALRAELYRLLARQSYMSAAAQPTEITWKPNKTKIAHVIESLQAVCLTHRPDGEPDVVSFANGALRLHADGTRELIEHSPARFNLTSLPFDYAPDAPAPEQWLAFLDSIFPDDPDSIELLREWFGYVLSGETSQQKLMLLVGPPRCGKGTIARVLEALVGHEYVAAPTLAQLGTNFGLSSLIGKSLAVVGDARFSGANQSVVVERLLSITGEDSIDVDRKNRDLWTGKINARFMILSNELPSLSEASGALAARFIGPLVLQRSFLGREDLSLGKRLLTELPGVLLWALDGLDALRDRGYFGAPETSRSAVRDLEDLSSPERAFMRDCCVKRRDVMTPTAELYRTFQRWSEDQGRRNIPTFPIFCRNLKSAYPYLKFARTIKGFARQTQVVEDVAIRPSAREIDLLP